MKNPSLALLVTIMSLLAPMSEKQIRETQFTRKERVKRKKIEKKTRVGRGKVAKGYDPETGKWKKD